MPTGTSAGIGVFPTGGLVPIAGVAPLDRLLDKTGLVARDVPDAAIAPGFLTASTLPAFVVQGTVAPLRGIAAAVPLAAAKAKAQARNSSAVEVCTIRSRVDSGVRNCWRV